MHTFGIVLVVLLEQHVVLFVHINLLVAHTKENLEIDWVLR
jgi:hypothetical protein